MALAALAAPIQVDPTGRRRRRRRRRRRYRGNLFLCAPRSLFSLALPYSTHAKRLARSLPRHLGGRCPLEHVATVGLLLFIFKITSPTIRMRAMKVGEAQKSSQFYTV